MKLAFHQRAAMPIFWFAQAVGVVTVLALIVFIGGTIIDELAHQLISFREDYEVFLFFFCEVLLAVAIIISWKRKRMGPLLMLALTILIGILWGREDMNIILLHLPLLFSGLFLLFYSYYKEWILKQKA
jgi:hypothetical protein